MGGEACRAHAQKRPVNRQWRWVSGKMKWFHTYRLPSAKLEPEEKLLEGAVADVSWLVSPRVATQNRPVGYVFCCCFLFYTYSLTIPDIPIIAKSVGPIFDKFSWLDELVSYEPMTVDNQSEIGFFQSLPGMLPWQPNFVGLHVLHHLHECHWTHAASGSVGRANVGLCPASRFYQYLFQYMKVPSGTGLPGLSRIKGR